MNEADLFKMAQKYDEDFSMADFENLNEEQEEERLMEENEKESFNKKFVKSVENLKNNNAMQIENKKENKKKQTKQNNNIFKEQYFGYYDDIKTPSNHKTEW